jgi:hypothetical protein
VPPATATVLQAAPAASTVPVGEPVTFEGDLRSAPGAGTPVVLATRTVALYARDAGSTTWTKVSTGTTDSLGHFVVGAAVARTADYQVRWAGDATYAASRSSVARVSTPTRRALAVDLHADRTLVRRGAPVLLYGHVTDQGAGSAGRAVKVYKKRLHGGHWRLVRQTTSKPPTGWWSITVHPLRARVFKAVVVGTTEVTGDSSRWAAVRVR